MSIIKESKTGALFISGVKPERRKMKSRSLPHQTASQRRNDR